MEHKQALEIARKAVLEALPDMEGAEESSRTEMYEMPVRSAAKSKALFKIESKGPRRDHAIRMRKLAKTTDGNEFHRLVHVRVDDDGMILKLVTSR